MCDLKIFLFLFILGDTMSNVKYPKKTKWEMKRALTAAAGNGCRETRETFRSGWCDSEWTFLIIDVNLCYRNTLVSWLLFPTFLTSPQVWSLPTLLNDRLMATVSCSRLCPRPLTRPRPLSPSAWRPRPRLFLVAGGSWGSSASDSEVEVSWGKYFINT